MTSPALRSAVLLAALDFTHPAAAQTPRAIIRGVVVDQTGARLHKVDIKVLREETNETRQSVTDVVRGQDLFWSTSVHRLLQALLGLPAPRYHHHRLIRDAEGQKLAKSTRSTSLRALREAGATPHDIRHMVGLA